MTILAGICTLHHVHLSICRAAGTPVAEATPVPGLRRATVYDPFGNRIEMIEIVEVTT